MSDRPKCFQPHVQSVLVLNRETAIATKTFPGHQGNNRKLGCGMNPYYLNETETRRFYTINPEQNGTPL